MTELDKGTVGSRRRLDRPILIHCCKDGTITYRTRKQKIFNDVALPVFSVDTIEEAKTLQIIFCRKAYANHPKMPGQPWYKLNHFAGTLEDLYRVGEMFETWYCEMKGKTP
jgi:hypothetical protein